jgi:hypothetical protein
VRTRLPAVAALATVAALTTTATAAAAPPAAVQATAPGASEPSLSLQVNVVGTPVAAVIGKNNSLWYLSGDTRSSTWHRTELAGNGSVFGGPSLVATSAPESEIAVQGARHTLVFYYQTGAGHWHHTTVAGPGHAYSAPSLGIGPKGPGIAVEGAKHTLWFYARVGGAWHAHQVSKGGTTYSAPSLVIRFPNQSAPGDPAGQADIAVQGPAHTLAFYRSRVSGPWLITHVLGPNKAYSAPSLLIAEGVDQAGEADIAVQGPNHSAYFNADVVGSRPGLPVSLDKGDVFSAPSLAENFQDPTDQVELAFQGLDAHTAVFLRYDGSSWQNDPIPAIGLVDSAPSMSLSVAGNGYGLIFQGPGNSLYYYFGTRPGSPSIAPSFTGSRVAGPGTTFGG